MSRIAYCRVVIHCNVHCYVILCFYASKDIQSSKLSVSKDNPVRWIGFPVFQSLSFQLKVGNECDIDHLAVFSDSVVDFVHQSDNLALLEICIASNFLVLK